MPTQGSSEMTLPESEFRTINFPGFRVETNRRWFASSKAMATLLLSPAGKGQVAKREPLLRSRTPTSFCPVMLQKSRGPDDVGVLDRNKGSRDRKSTRLNSSHLGI